MEKSMILFGLVAFLSGCVSAIKVDDMKVFTYRDTTVKMPAEIPDFSDWEYSRDILYKSEGETFILIDAQFRKPNDPKQVVRMLVAGEAPNGNVADAKFFYVAIYVRKPGAPVNRRLPAENLYLDKSYWDKGEASGVLTKSSEWPDADMLITRMKSVLGERETI